MKKWTAIFLLMGLVLSLCACGAAPAESTAEPSPQTTQAPPTEAPSEEPSPTPSPEPTPEVPKTFMEEHGLSFTMKLSSDQPGFQYAIDEGDSLVPENCLGSLAVVSLEQSPPDEEGYVTLTIVSEGVVRLEFLYTDADGDGRGVEFGQSRYGLFDRYTGTTLPERTTRGDDEFEYAITQIDVAGKDYAVSRKLTVQWDGDIYWHADGGSGNNYTHIVDRIRYPAEYDGLSLGWYVGEPRDGRKDYDDELELEERRVLCESDFSKLTDYRFVNVSTALSLFCENTAEAKPAVPHGQIGDESYQHLTKQFGSSVVGIGEDAKAVANNDEAGSPFVLRGMDDLYGFIGNRIHLNNVQEFSFFMLENHSTDRQIVLAAFDAEGNAIGSTGLLGPNDYLNRFTLDKPVKTREYSLYSYFVFDFGGDGGKQALSDVDLVSELPFTIMVYVYDMEGNLLGANTLEGVKYGNAYRCDWPDEG